ncbi:MAG: tetratricopeptide repeat protein, partial [Planctomycetota bacterium]
MKIRSLAIVIVAVLLILSAASAGHSEKFRQYYNKGVDAYRLGNYRTAIKWFRKAAALEEKDAATYASIGLCHVHLQEYKAAITAYKKAISLDRNKADYHARIAKAYGELKDYTHSIASYMEALKLNPKDIVSRYNLGLVFDVAGDSTKAEREFKTVLSEIESAIKTAVAEGDRKKTDFYRDIGFESRKSLAVLYHNRGDNDEAIRLLELARKDRPKNADIVYILGAVQLAKGNVKKAIEELKKSVELDTHRPEAHHALGNAYIAIKEYEKAIAAFEKAILESPSFSAAYYNLGEIYRFREDFDKALEMYNRASAIKPEDP